MELKKNLTLVCAGADAVAASGYGLPLLHLCMGVGPGGGIRRLRLPAQTQGQYLGVSDFGIEGSIPKFCAEALVLKSKSGGCAVFLPISNGIPRRYIPCCAIWMRCLQPLTCRFSCRSGRPPRSSMPIWWPKRAFGRQSGRISGRFARTISRPAGGRAAAHFGRLPAARSKQRGHAAFPDRPRGAPTEIWRPVVLLPRPVRQIFHLYGRKGRRPFCPV